MESNTATQSRLIGAILVEKGMLTPEQLEHALELQESSGERLGEIVVAEFGLSRLELASVLAEQWAEVEQDSSPRGTARAAVPEAPAPLSPDEIESRRPIGELFVDLGFVTPEQLEDALVVQRQTGARIGEILVEQGSLSRLDLASALAEQWSSLQKLRPPAPGPEPQPWQNGTPVVSQLGPVRSQEDASGLAELEERLRLVERAAAAAPWQQDLERVADEVRSALGAVEARLDARQPEAPGPDLGPALDAIGERLAALESASVEREIVALREEIQQLKGSPTDDAGLAAVRDAVERLEARPDPSDEISRLGSDLGELMQAFAGIAELTDRLDAVAGQAEVAQTGLAGLSRQVDELARLEGRLDEVASRLPAPELIEEVRRSLAEAAARPAPGDGIDHGADIASLVARLDQLSAMVDEVVSSPAPDLAPRIDELASRLDEVTRTAPEIPDALAARIESLEAGARVEIETIDRLAGEIAEVGLRTSERLDEVAAHDVSAELAELRARLDEIAAGSGDDGRLEELRAGLERVSASVASAPDSSVLDALRAGIEEQIEGVRSRLDHLAVLATRDAGPASIDELRGRVDALATSVSGAVDLATFDELRARVDAVAGHASRGLSPEEFEELRARVEAIAASVAGAVDSTAHDELRARVDAIAASVSNAVDAAAVDALGGRLDAIAGRIERAPDSRELDALRARLDELAAVVSAAADTSMLDVLHARVEELAASTATGESVRVLEQGFGELERRVVESDRSTELREEMRLISEAAAADRQTIREALSARVEELGSHVPGRDELDEIRARVEELAERPSEDHQLRARFDEATSRLADLDALHAAFAELRSSFATLDVARVGEALATGVRLSSLESAVESLAAGAGSRLDEIAAVEGRIGELGAEIARRPDESAFHGRIAELRAELEQLANRPTVEDPSERLGDLSTRLDGLERASHERIEGVAGSVQARIAELGRDLSARTEEQGASLRRDLDEVRTSVDEGVGAVRAALEDSERARHETHVALEQRLEAAADELRGELRARAGTFSSRLDAELGELRSALDTRDGELRSRLDAQAEESAQLRAALDALLESGAGRAEWESRFESTFDERFEGLAARIGNDVASVRDQAERAVAEIRAESTSLAMRFDELLTLRLADVKSARAASDDLAGRVDALTALRAEDAEAARSAAGDLTDRLERLAKTLRKEAADARAAAAEVGNQIAALHGLRAEDLAQAELAGAELAARLDDQAVRSAAAAREVEVALHDEIGGIAARLEERDAEGIEAREELRAELERVASSVGWRLERIEESLATHDMQEIRAAVAELETRLAAQVAIGDEQARATERALRKGLASLGERLTGTESAYLDAGNALRRSIERLGAAVVEADARIADQIPVTAEEGCVAFAPTSAGYRLIELPGIKPEIGETIEIEECDGPLVVTRYGRSPLPLDNRACAYLDRA